MSMFPAGWKVEPLHQVCSEIVDCLNKTATVVDGPTPYKMIRTTNVKGGRVNLEEARYVDEAVYRKWTRRFKPRRGDVILTREAPLGEVGLLRSDEHVFLGQRTMAYRANPTKLNQRFLYYSLIGPTLQAQIRMYGAGSTVEHMRVPQAESLQIHYPDLASQQKIAAILSAYDDLIANNQHRITLLERMAEDIYREWFVRLHFPGHEQVKIEKGVPQGWKPSSLGAIADFTMGQSPSSDFYNETGNGLPFHQGVGSYGPRYPIHETFCSVSGRKANPGDILFSVRAPVGRINIADRELIIGRGLAAIRHKGGLNGYLLYLLKVTFASEDIIGNGSIFNSVGKDELTRLGVFEPDVALAKKFEALVQPIDKQIAALYQANSSLKSTRDALLPRLISGKLAVDGLDIRFPPNSSPASQEMLSNP